MGFKNESNQNISTTKVILINSKKFFLKTDESLQDLVSDGYYFYYYDF